MTDSPAFTDVRPSSIAGTWYPGAASHLAAEVDGYLAAAEVAPPEGRLVGVMAPHAGYRYSGPVAGYAFRPVQDMAAEMQVDVVAVVSPIHRLVSHAPVLTTAHEVYRTPLGDVRVDQEAIEALRAAGLEIEAVRDDGEHSLEIELPFLQRALSGEFALIPLMLGDQSKANAERVGHALAEVLDKRDALLVASTDLSHFYDQQTANQLDRVMLDHVAAFDPAAVIDAEAKREAFACGRGAVAAVMWAARDLGADTAKVLRYATSGDAGAGFDRVVGYGAAVFYERG